MKEKMMVSILGRDSVITQSKGIYRQSPLKYGEIPIDIFQTNLATFIKNLSKVFDSAIPSMANYELNEIEINVDVSVTGGISLIGSVEAETSGGLTLRFKRIHNDE